MSRKGVMRIVFVQAFLVLMLAACQASESDSRKTAAQQQQQDKAQQLADDASLCTKNLLVNPEFNISDGQFFPQSWGASQHAGDQAYNVGFKSGELTIDKYGEQHWMLISQRVDPKAVAGRSVVFSAELKQDMNDDGWTQALEAGGGLSIIIRGTVPGSPFSQKILLSSSLQHEPKLGVFDWTPVSVSFDVPATVTSVDLGFLHQAYGKMSVRNPSLRIKSTELADCMPNQ